ncbi:MAG: 2-phospho-L-lactate guanylyltransferase [Dehalococcoidia bacterium]|nr:2-phospho-L-lactate guanylyltransferase [Dehalococcoidia bacterium]
MTGPLTLIPVNRLDRAKGRLTALLTPEERARLLLATLETVLAACREANFPVTLVTADAVVVRMAGPTVRVLNEEPGLQGLNEQLQGAMARLPPAPGGLLILHADLPLASARALTDLEAAAPPRPSATIVRSGDGGTNAMLLRPPGGFPLAYGQGSCARHEAAARAAGYALQRLPESVLGMDLDTVDDVRAFLALPAAAGTRAGQLLATRGLKERLARAAPAGEGPA